MKLKDYTKEELELMSYDEIAALILKESKKKMKINILFKKVCEIKGLSEEDFVNHIADFFELLTTDKKFSLLEDGYWDLSERHSEKMIIEDDDDEYDEVEETEPEEESEEEEDAYYDEENDDDSEDDLKDLVIVDEEEEEM